MDYVKAFIIGGIICALVQILMEKTKLLPGRIMVLLVCTGAILGAVGIFEPLKKFAGAGVTVPLLGFGNVLWTGVKEAIDLRGTGVRSSWHLCGVDLWLPVCIDFSTEKKNVTFTKANIA